jgi:hypothetical protein
MDVEKDLREKRKLTKAQLRDYAIRYLPGLFPVGSQPSRAERLAALETDRWPDKEREGSGGTGD